MSDHGRMGKVVLVVALLTALAAGLNQAAAAPESSGTGDSAELAGSARSLLGTLAATPSADEETVARKLIELGDRVAPALATLRTRPLNPAQVRVVARVGFRWKDPTMPRWLVSVAGSADDLEASVAAYGCLEDFGTPEILGELITTLSGNPPGAKRPAERALIATLRRSDDSKSYVELSRKLPELADEEKARLIACVADADTERGVALLGSLIGRYPGVDLAVLSGLARMTAEAEDAQHAVMLRSLISSDDPNLRREAVSVLGRLHDEASAEDIVALLEGDQAGVAGNAHWALRRLSRLNLPPDPQRWRMWLTEERVWWETQSEELLEALAGGDRADILRALHHLSLHPLYRGRFEQDIRDLMASEDEEIRQAASRALTGLGLNREARAGTPGTTAGIVSLRPATEAERQAATAPRIRKPNHRRDSGSSSPLLFLLGLPICGALLVRVGGWTSAQRIRDWWAGD